MAWSYSGDPSTSDLDKTRFLIGDTDSNNPLVSNEEIDWANSEFSDARLAGAALLDGLAAKYASRADAKAGDVDVKWSQLASAFSARADKLRRQGYSLALPYFGGLSKDEKRTLSEDEDAVQPGFAVGMDDYPGTLDSATSSSDDDYEGY